MQNPIPLTFGDYFHIYNHGVGNRNLFCEPENYEYFLDLYDQHISPLADTFAWVLMPNHFHFLVRIKEKAEITEALQQTDTLHLTGFKNLSGVKYLSAVKKPVVKPPHQYFSNLFNAYTKALNIRLGSHGTLFERPFKRKLIDNDDYLKHVILYIHNNPVHHGFCSHPVEYSWSSYLTCISIKPSKLKRDVVMGWFDEMANFKFCHNEKVDVERIDKWLDLL